MDLCDERFSPVDTQEKGWVSGDEGSGKILVVGYRGVNTRLVHPK